MLACWPDGMVQPIPAVTVKDYSLMEEVVSATRKGPFWAGQTKQGERVTVSVRKDRNPGGLGSIQVDGHQILQARVDMFAPVGELKQGLAECVAFMTEVAKGYIDGTYKLEELFTLRDKKLESLGNYMIGYRLNPVSRSSLMKRPAATISDPPPAKKPAQQEADPSPTKKPLHSPTSGIKKPKPKKSITKPKKCAPDTASAPKEPVDPTVAPEPEAKKQQNTSAALSFDLPDPPSFLFESLG
eukprot:14902129-Alexandrium_andersonii.AAC.2